MDQAPQQPDVHSKLRSKSIIKFQNAVNHISMIQNSLQKIRHKQQQRELWRTLLLKETVNIENEEECEFVIHIIGKDARSQDHIDYLKRAFYHLKFFTEKSQMLSENLYDLLFKTVQHQLVKKQQAVFNYGETFYIILKGQAALLVPRNSEEANEEQFQQEYIDGILRYNTKYNIQFKSNEKRGISDCSQSSSKNFPQIKKVNNKRISMMTDEVDPSNKVSLKHVMKAQAFSQFFNVKFEAQQMKQTENQQKVFVSAYQSQLEDFALQNYDPQLVDFFLLCYPSFRIAKIFVLGDSFGEIALMTSQARTATVVCLSDTQFMTLSKISFENIIDKYRLQMYKEKFQLLRDFPLFNTLPQQLLHQIIDYMSIQKPRMFEIIYKENQPADYLYIIKEGEVEIDCLQEIQESPFQQSSMTKKVNLQARNSVALLLTGFIFGHEDIIQQQNRKQRAVAKSSQCELYLLPAKVQDTIANKYGNVQETLQLNHLLNLINKKNLKNAEQIKHKHTKSQENLALMLNTQLSNNDKQEQTEKKHFKSSESTPQVIHFSSNQKPSASPKNTPNQQTFNDVFESVSRMETATTCKHLIRIKRQVQMKHQYHLSKEKDFQPFFSQEYLRQMVIEKSRNLFVPLRGTQSSQIKSDKKKASSDHNSNAKSNIAENINLQSINSDYSTGQKLLHYVFRTQSRQQLSKILSNPIDRIHNKSQEKEEGKVNKINFTIPQDEQMNEKSNPSYKELSPQNSVNIHTHLFSPKLSKQQMILKRNLILNIKTRQR